MRVSGQFTSEASLKAVNLRINDRFFKGGKEILESVWVFWDGLNKDRLNKVYK